MASPGSSPLRFSTDDFPERSRLEAMNEVIGRAIMKADIEPLPGVPYRGDVAFYALPGLRLNSATGVGIQVRRSAQQIDNDDLVLSVSMGGGHFAGQRGREVWVGKGEAVLVTGSEPTLIALPKDERMLAFRVPLNVIAPMVADLDAVLARRIPDTELLRLLVSYSEAVFSTSVLENPDARRVIASHIHDLVALVLGPTRETAEIARGRGLGVARLGAIKADIVRGLATRELTVNSVAAGQRVTPRYVQQLFERDGTTFSRFVLEQRLARAHRMLGDPGCSDFSIASIAFEVGFGDLSTFNHAFRRRYGATPSEVRAAAREQS